MAADAPSEAGLGDASQPPCLGEAAAQGGGETGAAARRQALGHGPGNGEVGRRQRFGGDRFETDGEPLQLPAQLGQRRPFCPIRLAHRASFNASSARRIVVFRTISLPDPAGPDMDWPLPVPLVSPPCPPGRGHPGGASEGFFGQG
jgi:hypothetical protein